MTAVEAMDRLVGCLGRLPGVGRRTAERMAMKIAQRPEGLLADLQIALRDTRESVRWCKTCGGITSADAQPCRLCTDATRDAATLCVVEDSGDIQAIERCGVFRGRYHALQGRISPSRGEGINDLRVRSLLDRVEKEGTREVILALNTDMESDATASFLSDLLRQRKVRVTRLAFGLPVGSGILFADPVTLARAVRGRQAT